jgi:hypothetical protein
MGEDHFGHCDGILVKKADGRPNFYPKHRIQFEYSIESHEGMNITFKVTTFGKHYDKINYSRTTVK